MAKISDTLKKKATISFEFFPPKDEKGDQQLWKTIEELSSFSKSFKPDFVSVTFGAGGSTKQRTREISSKIKNEYNLEVVEHFTCYGLSKSEIEDYIKDAKEKNIDNILALRGDKPRNNPDFTPAEDSLKNAAELVEFINKRADFCTGVATYPEKHPDAKTIDDDIDFLKKKIDKGADFIVTQLFFDNDNFFKYMEKVRSRGIEEPVITGILPVISYNNLVRFTEMSAAIIPDDLKRVVINHKHDNDYITKFGIDYALKQIESLEKQGLNSGIHFYGLNRSYSCIKILKSMGF